MSHLPNTPPAGFATRAIHFGYDPMQEHGALTPPLHLTSTYAFESAEAGGEIFAGDRAGYLYSRVSNPTNDLLERRIASLEGAEAALANASGMGAITSLLWTYLQPGDEIITDLTLYGCTFALFQHGLARFGVKITHIDMTDPANLAQTIGPKTRFVYFETPANPNMRLVDIARVSQIAHQHGAQVIVDNTYATPMLTRPIELGADFVVHSATKYLGGHGDLLAGLVAFAVTSLALMGFVYDSEFAQAIFLLGFPLLLVAMLSVRTAHIIQDQALAGEALVKRIQRHRLHIQLIGMASIFVTAMWGMYQNMNANVLG